MFSGPIFFGNQFFLCLVVLMAFVVLIVLLVLLTPMVFIFLCLFAFFLCLKKFVEFESFCFCISGLLVG